MPSSFVDARGRDNARYVRPFSCSNASLLVSWLLRSPRLFGLVRPPSVSSSLGSCVAWLDGWRPNAGMRDRRRMDPTSTRRGSFAAGAARFSLFGTQPRLTLSWCVGHCVRPAYTTTLRTSCCCSLDWGPARAKMVRSQTGTTMVRSRTTMTMMALQSSQTLRTRRQLRQRRL